MAAASLSPTPSTPSAPDGDIRTVLCDLDGVVWLAHEPIAGSSEAIARLRASGRRVLFVTNNSAGRIDQHVAALAAVGVPATGDVISSATAAAYLIEPGERVLVTGGPGIVEAMEQRGAVPILNDGTVDVRVDRVEPFDAVVVGLHRDFDYARLRSAAAALHCGARLIGTNSDTTYPTPLGLDPGGGAIVAAVAAAGEVRPTFAGKPHQPMAAAIAAVLDGDFDPATTVMVGDRPETDGLMAVELGCRFALVRSGVTRPGDIVARGRGIDIDIDDLAALADAIVG